MFLSTVETVCPFQIIFPGSNQKTNAFFGFLGRFNSSTPVEYGTNTRNDAIPFLFHQFALSELLINRVGNSLG